MLSLFSHETTFSGVKKTIIVVSILVLVTACFPIQLNVPELLLPAQEGGEDGPALRISNTLLLTLLLLYQLYLLIRHYLLESPYRVVQAKRWEDANLGLTKREDILILSLRRVLAIESSPLQKAYLERVNESLDRIIQKLSPVATYVEQLPPDAKHPSVPRLT